jgi:nicotinate-nucleotide adenylyltransferase
VSYRLGLLGGTFDPPHYGHLILAQEAGESLRLEQVLFLPTRQNPLKRCAPGASSEDRYQMVRLAIADNPLLALSRADLDRPPPSYSVDLLRSLRRQYEAETDFFMLVDADVLDELPLWHQPLAILSLATLLLPIALVRRSQTLAFLRHACQAPPALCRY